jgi:hypothetical protein
VHCVRAVLVTVAACGAWVVTAWMVARPTPALAAPSGHGSQHASQHASQPKGPHEGRPGGTSRATGEPRLAAPRWNTERTRPAPEHFDAELADRLGTHPARPLRFWRQPLEQADKLTVVRRLIDRGPGARARVSVLLPHPDGGWRRHLLHARNERGTVWFTDPVSGAKVEAHPRNPVFHRWWIRAVPDAGLVFDPTPTPPPAHYPGLALRSYPDRRPPGFDEHQVSDEGAAMMGDLALRGADVRLRDVFDYRPADLEARFGPFQPAEIWELAEKLRTGGPGVRGILRMVSQAGSGTGTVSYRYANVVVRPNGHVFFADPRTGRVEDPYGVDYDRLEFLPTRAARIPARPFTPPAAGRWAPADQRQAAAFLREHPGATLYGVRDLTGSLGWGRRGISQVRLFREGRAVRPWEPDRFEARPGATRRWPLKRLYQLLRGGVDWYASTGPTTWLGPVDNIWVTP